jgi:hypothetical protein
MPLYWLKKDEVDEAAAKIALEAVNAMERIGKDMEQRDLRRRRTETRTSKCWMLGR